MFDPEFIRSQTAAMRNPAPVAPLDRDQKIANLIHAEFGCHKTQTRQLVELLLEHDLPEPQEQSTVVTFLAGAVLARGANFGMVLSLDSDGDANMIDADRHPVSPSGGTIATQSEFERGDITVATAAQTERFIRKITGK